MRRVDERALDVLLMPLPWWRHPQPSASAASRSTTASTRPGDHPGTRVLERLEPMVPVGACVSRPAATSFLPGICYELAGVTRLSTQIDRARREAKIAGDGPGAGAVRHLDGTALMVRIWQSAGRCRRQRSRALERHRLPPARRRTPAAVRGGGRGDLPMPVAPINERAAEIHNQLLDDINVDAWPARAADSGG